MCVMLGDARTACSVRSDGVMSRVLAVLVISLVVVHVIVAGVGV